MFYIIGLGNPGTTYAGTRHNIGFALLDAFQEEYSLPDWSDNKYASAKQTSGEVNGVPVTLLKPQTYMNRSGDTAKYLVEKEGVSVSDIVVVYDDVDLALGDIKISVGRGDGGHNGIKSLVQQIGKDFVRVRVGVASKSFWTGETKRPNGKALHRHVLGKFSIMEHGVLRNLREKVMSTLVSLMTEGVVATMNRTN